MSQQNNEVQNPDMETTEPNSLDTIPHPDSAYGQELDATPEAVTIFEQWCKGCEICVYFCTKDVLAMSPHGKAVVVNPHNCIQCGLCWIHCPDFAIVSMVK